jgi:hypothetical protein
MGMKQNWGLVDLKISYILLETVVSTDGAYPRQSAPQIHLIAVAPVTREKRYGGEIFIFERDSLSQRTGFWRMYDTGLFQAEIAVDRRTLDLLWQAVAAPHDWFLISLNCPETEPGIKVAVDIEFSYKIARGKSELDQIPFPSI